jgi:hypothetical protein
MLPWKIRMAAAALAVMLAGTFAVSTTTRARAAVGDLACLVPFVLSFDPPLTSVDRTSDIGLSGTLLDCLSADGQYSRLTSGRLTGSGSAESADLPLPCPLAFTATGTADVLWNTGERSKLTFSVNSNPTSSAAALGLTAKVVDGPLTKDQATATPTVLPNLDCLTSGLKELTSPTNVSLSFGLG